MACCARPAAALCRAAGPRPRAAGCMRQVLRGEGLLRLRPTLATVGHPGPARLPVAPVALLDTVLDKVLNRGPTAEATQRKYAAQVAAINALAPAMRALSDDELRAQTAVLKARLAAGAALNDVLPAAFAAVREASDRVLGLRPFDVQLMGGLILHEGQIAEMRTGEGKTLVAVLPSYLNALLGKGVHVVTVNDYLARRDAEWVGQVHRFMGLSVGLVQAGAAEAARKEAYGSDVTYVTNSELGFDYLRDNLAQAVGDIVQRPFHYCIIDEVDSILVDDARTPLIISKQADKPSAKYLMAAQLASALQKGTHYAVDEKQRSVTLTDEGYEATEDALGVGDRGLYDPQNPWASYVTNALKAKELQKRDVAYLVKGGEVVIVDESTGRLMVGRRWSDGLHQAVEAKEGVEIQNETVTLASVSYQAFFLRYPKLAGMTGTAATERDEFTNIYKLPVAVVPTNRPVLRQDAPDAVYRSVEGKWRAVAAEVAKVQAAGRPVLVGTTNVAESEALGTRLAAAGVRFQLLNAKPENVERESEIVAQSGRSGAVTIATNMAGRGTDILLGGNPEYMARLKLREHLMPAVVAPADDAIAFEKRRAAPQTPKSWRVAPEAFACELTPETRAQIEAAVTTAAAAWGGQSLPELEAEDRLAFACERAPTADPASLALRSAFDAAMAEYRVVTDFQRRRVVTLGGLHVVGTERHESRRIDNQLRGRSGRQGDPGSTRYFLSLEDNLFRIFGGDRIKGLMSAFGVGDLPIESGMLSGSLDEAQRKVELYFFDIRKQLFDYDVVLNLQREKVYRDRRTCLAAPASELDALLKEYAELTVDDILAANVPQADSTPPAAWPLDDLARKLGQYCAAFAGLTGEDLLAEATGAEPLESLRESLRCRAVGAYEAKAAAMDAAQPGLCEEVSRLLLLSQVDRLWQRQLEAMKFLQQSVAMRGYAQKDPLVEYKLEGYALYREMQAQVRRNVIYSLYMFDPAKMASTEPAGPGVAQLQAAVAVPRARGGGRPTPQAVGAAAQ